MKTIMLKPELYEQLRVIQAEIYENTFIDYTKNSFTNEDEIKECIQDNLSDFGETSCVEDIPQLEKAKIRTNIGDYEVDFTNEEIGKSHDHNDSDIYHIESAEVILKKL